ncbi:hypothetical protein KIL84_010226 [Mauremys mutica]|uniref:CID domain-containing protein n=1 Tax=Mauremys mutica TaxID=74926 RepID=A0A9D4AZL4_9SAUR|nr:hypothetical protein KIL84_010226 [Mauremys mutica]
MSSFSESALEKKLSELSNSQQSVQTLSLWLIHHRKHAGPIVSVWHRELRKAKSSRKLTFLYLANDVIQNSKRKGPEFTREFESVLVDAFSHVAREADEGCKKPLERLLNIWQERSVYGSEFIQQLKLSMEDTSSPPPKATLRFRVRLFAPNDSSKEALLSHQEFFQSYEQEPHNEEEYLVEYEELSVSLAILSLSPDEAVTPSTMCTIDYFKTLKDLLKRMVDI